ncbi:glycine dehydrogenase [Beutenbergia cavernae DSM 12333]|uniref:Glycine dehydrogenase (decarboxylating) n=1 Tax=Beutenbergia cavernae (strain ATCC BAA-8 / DSM 12333 / CCUG 43141 / JCM 11478 / NBRC 16432 / NCIMB 13614 / HKI 0122) TaxID=471853 RepID=C5C5I1_BEUC1|nr:aminomethyl-transferring glycine dehydrogenase [Beutenbergia cavernae]ACQ80172.1 glycine dehydrogenase [Beutenbergia cavernae DSM 12333]
MSEFARRHIGPDEAETAAMLATLGRPSAGQLLREAIPEDIATTAASSLPHAADEASVLAELRAIASRNTVRTSMIGQGYYDTLTPSVLVRGILENPAWYTAYTPYQPEISQGRLEALLNFQTMVEDLTGLPVAGASMLDESTAVAEAMLLARRVVRGEGGTFLVDSRTFPQTKAVLATRAEPLGIRLAEFDPTAAPEESLLEDAFGAVIQYPAADGLVYPRSAVEAWAAAVHDRGGQLVLAADLLALTLLASPASLGADMAAGTTQRFGVPMGFGGPHAGYLAVRDGLQRQLPGRLVGVSVDAEGAPALRLALQTREQHIRRERATSNICTAQVLLAVLASMYAVYHGPTGLRAIAERVHGRAVELAAELRVRGADVVHARFFDTLTVRVPGRAAELARAALERGVTIWVADADTVSLSCDEATTPSTLAAVLAAVDEAAPTPDAHVAEDDGAAAPAADDLADLSRDVDYLLHPVFSRFHSETAMMRYLRTLADRDYALDRGMIPLGSCTMKLNAATEMAAITWPEFARIHPFAPRGDVQGYLDLIGTLEGWLADLTGYDAVRVQPNAGSQGELAGLLAVRRYHEANGESGRDVCLVPSSAHGTNAASAVLAGMRVKVVACDDGGNVDVEDLRRVLAAHDGEVAAIMVTYPSTHGVYESSIREICSLVHDAGGQVYIDGANLNALLGAARPGEFGGDVSHLNLHKTFCIPHGGGGPGVGPVAARSHLVPYLPGHPLDPADGPTDGAVSAAPYGSASILPISWAYVRLMGAEGLLAATRAAVLSANYVASRLEEHFPVLYRGNGDLVAHECILDLRPLTKETGITVDDVAKRLIDYGFHAPTMSFPVAGTLMVEPTESEDLREIDRFCDAMIAIAGEARAVADGEWSAEDNPLVNAPHTAVSLVGDWAHPYSRAQAVFPVPGIERNKYWPPVRRIDGAFGDRHLVCSCAGIEAYAT